MARAVVRHAMVCRAAGTARSVALACLGIAFLGDPVRAAAPPLPAPAGQCATVDLQADQAFCENGQCTLLGQAHLACGALVLSADRIDVSLDAARHFAGAQAKGNVVLVQGPWVLAAGRLTVASDKIRGQIDDATLMLRRTQAPMGGRVAAPGGDEATGDNAVPNNAMRAGAGRDWALPCGRNAMVLHGKVTRESADVWKLQQADATLCDCGPSRSPSWRVDAPRIDVTRDRRAIIWWPRLKVALWGHRLVPVTPPLLPLSVPLTDRALGFLPPRLAFLQVPYPTVDLPFFVPLGPSWDLTVAPGLRTDWLAPRLGLRVRYHPHPSSSGRLRIGYTHDGRQAMAQQRYTRDTAADPALAQSPAYLAQHAQRRALTERVSIDVQHQTHLTAWGGQVDGLVDAAWISDDLYNRDFLIAPAQRVAAYLPSRAALMWRHPTTVAALTADAMLLLESREPFPAGLEAGPQAAPSPTLGAEIQPAVATLPTYSNVHGAEASTLHRAPAVSVAMLPHPLGHGLAIDGILSAVRYGNWTGEAPQGPTDQAQTILGAEGGLGLHRPLGPLSLMARAGFDSIYVQAAGNKGFFDTAPLTEAELTLPLHRRYGAAHHIVRPRLAYRGVEGHEGAGGPLVGAATDALDPRLVRRQSQQVVVAVQQEVRTHGPRALRLSGEVGQPIDVRQPHLLQPFLTVQAAPWPNMQLGGQISVDPRRWSGEPVRSLAVQFSQGWRPATLDVAYSRIAPDADTFQRSIYELAAPLGVLEPATGVTWAHLVRLRLDVRLGTQFDASYATAYALPQPEQGAGAQAACVRPGQPGGRAHCFASHLLRIGYVSPCDCWALQATLSADPQDVRNSLRFSLLFNLTGRMFKRATRFF